MSDSDLPPSPNRIDQVLFAGLAGVSVGAVLQLVDKQPKLENAIGAALLCLAVAIPLLASSFLMEVSRPDADKSTGRRLFDVFGILLALGGMTLLFFHLHLVAGGVFLASVFVCVVVVVRSLR